MRGPGTLWKVPPSCAPYGSGCAATTFVLAFRHERRRDIAEAQRIEVGCHAHRGGRLSHACATAHHSSPGQIFRSWGVALGPIRLFLSAPELTLSNPTERAALVV